MSCSIFATSGLFVAAASPVAASTATGALAAAFVVAVAFAGSSLFFTLAAVGPDLAAVLVVLGCLAGFDSGSGSDSGSGAAAGSGAATGSDASGLMLTSSPSWSAAGAPITGSVAGAATSCLRSTAGAGTGTGSALAVAAPASDDVPEAVAVVTDVVGDVVGTDVIGASLLPVGAGSANAVRVISATVPHKADNVRDFTVRIGVLLISGAKAFQEEILFPDKHCRRC